MASGWNLWVWLQCIGVASRCCYREVYRYPHNNYILIFPTSLVLGLFWQQHPYFFVHFKMFFRSCFCYFFTIYSTLLIEHSRSFKKIEIPRI